MAKRTLTALTFALALLTLVSCILSISNNDIYQDGDWANAQWLGQDIVTLLLVFPLLLLSFFNGITKGQEKWILVYGGILFYYAYTYSFFMFAANLTVLYLFHLPIFGLSVIAFVITCIGLFGQQVEYRFEKKSLRVAISSYLILFSLMMSFLWLNDIFSHLVNPAHISDTPSGAPPLIIYSLDLGIIIPLMLAAAILLLMRTNWGYILTGLILTKTSTLGFALMAMAASMYVQDLNPDYFLIILWSILGIIGTSLTLLYLKHAKIKGSNGMQHLQ